MSNSTEEKIEVMEAFVCGKDIIVRDICNGLVNTCNKKTVKELAWDWKCFYYSIDKLEFHTVGYVNTSKGIVRNNRIYDTEGLARLNKHSEDDRAGIRINVTFKEV